jgi:predicted signal transduction protein with EAL and GGDEF domain
VEVDGRPVMATVSVGMVFNEDSTFDVSALLAQADQALYHAKERGRNRVEIASLELVRLRKEKADAREAPAIAAASAA